MEGGAGGRGVRPYKKLMGMGSHFHDWIDYNGVVHFRIFGGKIVNLRLAKVPECLCCR